MRRLNAIFLLGISFFSGFIYAQDINRLIGSLPPGKSVTITFRAEVNTPVPGGVSTVSNQAVITGVNFSDVSSDDPDVGGASDATVTDVSSNPLPVELVSFTADINQNNVLLKWSTASETNNYGFEIERLKGSKTEKLTNWEKADFVKGAGNSNSIKEYVYNDRNLSNGNYAYRLKQIDNDGKFDFSEEIEVSISSVPAQYSLTQNYPNPFNPSTKIEYSLPYDSNVKLAVYNILGERVSLLVNEVLSAGFYNAEWNAAEIPSGIYFYVLETGSVDGKENFKTVRKMILLK